jgi:NAD(P)H-hydrate epimerase
LGRDPSTAALVRRVVEAAPVAFVLDADGLNAFAGRGAVLARRTSEAVITPHAGEFARLTGVVAATLEQDRVGHARKAAREFQLPVLLKGPATIVAEPSGQARVNPTGGPALATAGTGDVLTGTIAALLAQGLGTADAAVLGAFIHGMAGDLAGAELGDGTTASDVMGCMAGSIADLRALGSAGPDPGGQVSLPSRDGERG